MSSRDSTTHGLMPVPAEMTFGDGTLAIDHDFKVALSGDEDPRVCGAAARLVERVFRDTGIPIHRRPAATSDDARLVVHVEQGAGKVQRAEEDESYTLEIDARRAVIHAPRPYGALRGIETFLQLVRLAEDGFGVPVARIVDRPRFPWRGLLIDAVRHWIPPEVIKRNLEAMATVKLNVLHWHLTDDQGFRIESRRYPGLHESGSEGQFYTQEQVREIVEFAGDRGIRVVPEFDMPGHTTSWFVGHPELAGGPGPYRIERRWGVHDGTMDPSRDETYGFVREFLNEMTALFPDRFVHIGGDEVNGREWDANPQIGRFRTIHGLEDGHRLQAYFNRRVHGILRDLGKEMIGWDPVFHPDLPEGSVVQTFRGREWLGRAARGGYRTIASSEYYLDHLRPAAFLYTSDPLDGDASDLTAEPQELVFGGEASMWTEFADAENLDSRIWPRAAVVAERLWSPRDVTDVDEMYRRLAIVDRRLVSTGVTHDSGPRRMLYRLAGYGRIGALRTLAETLEPLFEVRWNNREYDSRTPLNRLVDATVPDSAGARRLMRLVDAFLKHPAGKDARVALETQLRTWRDNHDRLAGDIRRAALLAEVEPLSATLPRVADAGLQAVAALHGAKIMSSAERDGHLELLDQVCEPVADLRLAIVPGVRRLVEATSG